MGVATGCGCKEVYRFLHTTYHYSSCICSFFAAASILLLILKCFSFLYIHVYIFQAVSCAVNVLMFLRVSKYPSSAIFHNEIINTQRANVTGLNDLAYNSAAAYVEHAFARPMLASY